MKSIYKVMFTEMCCLYLDILIGGGICWLAVAKVGKLPILGHPFLDGRQQAPV